jgi:hypothetical protein
MTTKTKTKTKLPADLPNIIAHEIKRCVSGGRKAADVWVITNSDVSSSWVSSPHGSRAQLWMLLYKGAPPHDHMIYGCQWEQWTHKFSKRCEPVVGTTDWWEWDQDYAHRQWEKLVAEGWKRIV